MFERAKERENTKVREDIFSNDSYKGFWTLKVIFFLKRDGLQMKLVEWPGSLARDRMNHRVTGEHANKKLLV